MFTLLAALLAGTAIAVYTRYTSRLTLSQVILGSHAFIISNVIVFWFLLSLYDFGGLLYAFYMWSAIVGLVAVAQFWTLANELFNPREGKRLFGVLTAAGTVGGVAGGLGANWAVNFLFGTRHLLWLIVFLFAGAFSVVWFALRDRERDPQGTYGKKTQPRHIQVRDGSGAFGTLRRSRYLQNIAVLIFLSVIVSTLIDYQFKAAAKESYVSANALAGFFGSYYAWLSVITLLVQVGLTRTLLMGLGLTQSLLLLPSTLLAGSTSLLIWPGLFTATGVRLAEASLRTSVNRSAVEILYLPIPDFIKNKIKVFLDVTVERLGDGTAAVIILFYTLFLGGSQATFLSYFSIGLIVAWAAVVLAMQRGYIDALRRSLEHRELSLEDARIDYADKRTIEAVLKTLEENDEGSVLFGLDIAKELDSKIVVPRLPRYLLHHSSPEVRRRALVLFARYPDPSILKDVSQLLASESALVQAEAIKNISITLRKDAIPFIQPFLESPKPEVRSSAILCLLQYGDAQIHQDAMDALRNLLADRGPGGERNRVEAVRLMGELKQPEIPVHLSTLIAEDSSPTVVGEAITAAARLKYPGLVPEIITRLSHHSTKIAAREALVQYGEMAVKALRNALFDDRVSRDIRLNIPRTLSKIHSQAAMNALLGGLLEEDSSIRFQAILALDEMARRFHDLKLDREIVETAIVSDAMLCAQRFAIFYVLFPDGEEVVERASLLRQALIGSMERVRERVLWLLSLIYPAKDLRGIWGALNSGDRTKQAHAVELVENLLTGDIKRHSLFLYGDAPEPVRFRIALGLLGWGNVDVNTALRRLLQQGDIWLTAATVWEIGRRGVGEFHASIAPFLDSEHLVLREAAEVVISRGFELAKKAKKLVTIEKVIFLKSVDIFAYLSVEQLGRIAGLTEEVHFDPNEPIFHEGEPIDALYLLLRGRIVLEKNGQKAREISEGNAFGTVAALDFNPAVHTVKAVSHVDTLRLDARDLHHLLAEDIELVEGVIRVLCRMIRASQ